MNAFDEAIAVLERDGWTRGKYTADDGRHCLAGAIGVACHAGNYSSFQRVLYQEMRGLLREIMPERSVLSWNDDPERTIDDVIHLLKQASEAWDLEHPE